MKLLSVVCWTMVAACTQAPEPVVTSTLPPPGVTKGTWIPSAAIQTALRGAEDRRFVDSSGALGGGELIVRSGFSVTPNPISGLGPNALLVRPGRGEEPVPAYGEEQGTDGFYWVPFGSDADCADFLRRVGVEPGFAVDGALTELYRATIGLR